MNSTFEDLQIDKSIIAALKKNEITIPTDIQQKAIPLAIENKNIIVQSETGTGKTLAFLLPLFAKLDPSSRTMQGVIIVPTHELAIQIIRLIENISQNSDVKLRPILLIGNVNIERQIDKLKEKPHIIVGSPGRILELIKRKKVSMHTVKTIVVDEADRMMDDRNIDSVKAIVKCTLKDRQILMYSASISKQAKIRAEEIMINSEFIKSDDNIRVPDEIKHIFFVSEERDKVEVLRKVLKIDNPQKVLIFALEKSETEILTTKLRYHGFKVASIHGFTKKLERKKSMDDFKAGKINILIASDLAARGLDIEGITHIINLNMPEDPKDYLHRVGRTGRNGKSGMAISIITLEEFKYIKSCEKTLKIKIEAKTMSKGIIIDTKRPNPVVKKGKKY